MKLVHDLYGICFQYNVKNWDQPSNSTSCSDNALCLLVLVVDTVYWGLQVTSSNAIWPFKIYLSQNNSSQRNPKLKMKGIEDFNLEHWLQGSAKLVMDGNLKPSSPMCELCHMAGSRDPMRHVAVISRPRPWLSPFLYSLSLVPTTISSSCAFEIWDDWICALRQWWRLVIFLQGSPQFAHK